jgi:hypothetical protein
VKKNEQHAGDYKVLKLKVAKDGLENMDKDAETLLIDHSKLEVNG